MPSLRALAALTMAVLSTTAAAVGSSTTINNCGFDFDTHIINPSTGSSSQSTLAAGASSGAVTHTTDGYRIELYKTGAPSAIVAFETALNNNVLFYDVYVDGSSPVGDAFKLTSSDAACHSIQGGEGNFDPVQPDTYTCGTNASLTFMLCS